MKRKRIQIMPAIRKMQRGLGRSAADAYLVGAAVCIAALLITGAAFVYDAAAEEKETPVSLTMDSCIDVTVPECVHFTRRGNSSDILEGSYCYEGGTAGEAFTIENNSPLAVSVSLSARGLNGWSIVPYSTRFLSADSRTYALYCSGNEGAGDLYGDGVENVAVVPAGSGSTAGTAAVTLYCCSGTYTSDVVSSEEEACGEITVMLEGLEE